MPDEHKTSLAAKSVENEIQRDRFAEDDLGRRKN